MNSSLPSSQKGQDLSLLATLHYALAATEVLSAVMLMSNLDPLSRLAAGEFDDALSWTPSPSVAWALAGIALAGTAFFSILSPLTLLAGRRIAQTRSLGFCIAVAKANLFFVPWGMLLGFYALQILRSPSVTIQFGEEPHTSWVED